jgi:hypothetical protein
MVNPTVPGLDVIFFLPKQVQRLNHFREVLWESQGVCAPTDLHAVIPLDILGIGPFTGHWGKIISNAKI